jgi:hypothetical protein
MLTQDIVLQYLNSGQPIKLLNSIAELLSEASQLTSDDRTGLVVASFILGGACWSSSVKMLGLIAPDERIELFNTFTLYVARMYSTKVAEWVVVNWKVVEEQHLKLIKHVKQMLPIVPQPLLNLSLGVTIVEIPRFVECAEIFVTCPAAGVVLECLANKPK